LFPTDQSNDQIKLKEAAEAKIQAFISLLGADAKLLTEDEVPEGHSLFSRMLSKEMIEGEDSEEESELGYLQEIRELRDNNPKLFAKVKRLPKKARTVRKSVDKQSKLLTYFRKGKVQKFFIVDNLKENDSEEVDFVNAAQTLSAKPEEKRLKTDKLFFDLLEKNMSMLSQVDEFENDEFSAKRGSRDNSARLYKILNSKQIKNCERFTEDDEDYVRRVIVELNSGGIPKKITQNIYQEIINNPEIIDNPIKVLGILKTTLPAEFLQESENDVNINASSKKEIILSEYFRTN